jgi:Ca2+-binding RTX toxin-like protein
MNILNSVLPITYNQLIDFANKNNFWQVFDTAFGTQYNRSLAEILRLQWETGDFSQLPQIEVLDSSILGSANGAYASSENRIYLSNTFVASASLAAISGVLLEEIGHFVDAKINQTDSAGDEGAIFAALVQGQNLDVETLRVLKAEDDHSIVTLNGQSIPVEQQNFTGTDGNDTIIGSSEDDTINTLRGQDTVDGGAGNDLLILDYSSNNISGINSSISSNGNGGFNGNYKENRGLYYLDDQVSFSNIERFQITGTALGDSIVTGGGNDTINGDGGDDTIYAGGGNDTINGDGGDDTIYAGDDNDTINGGAGDDTITAGTGINIIDGGDGIDTLTDANFSSATAAITINDSNNPTITVPDGTSVTNIEKFINVSTGSGNDLISFTQRLNNTVSTGDGDDTINAGLGQDTVDGGAGNDLLILDYSSNNISGINSSISSNGNGGFNGNYKENRGLYYLDDQVSFSNIERFQITGTALGDSIVTGDGNDTINSGAGDDTIYAGGGNDTINGVNGASLTRGLGEIDSLTGGAGSDRFILGNATKAYYDDGNTLTNGSNDYADITDFNIGDIIQLQGTSSNYLLAVVGADTQILINKPNTEPDELIGIVRNQTGLSLTGTYFSYVFDNTPPTNQAPTNITLNNSTIAENQPINTVVGNFTTIDPNTGDTFTYSLVSGTGDTDNDSFIIVGNNELQTNSGFDYETKNSYGIRVKTTDQGGLSFEKQLTIGVTDVNEPVANLSISPSNVTQTEGNSGTKAFTFTVTRSEDTSSSSSANWAVTGSGTNQADVTDFGGTLPTGTVGFAAGETTKTIIVDVLGDTTVEPDEGFTVTLSNSTNATITTATAVGTITNDDRTLTPITDYAPNVNISTGLIFSTNGGGNLSLDTNRLSASNEVTSVQNGTKSNFNHLFGIYEVVDAEGGINTEKGVLKPGDSDYARYALTTARVKDFIVQAGSSDTPSTATQLGSGVSLQGNKFYAPFVIANCGTYFPNLQQGVEDFVAAENGDVNRFANALQYVRDLVATEAGNEFNNAPRFVQEPVAYFSFGSANPDKSPHLRSYGNGVYGFEDLPATATQYSNNDFNDAVFALS